METHYQENRDELLSRLRRIEGQVRGVQKMVEEDRYCVDVVHQINAFSAAAREITVMVVESHLRACAVQAVEDEKRRDEMIQEMSEVLRKTLRP